MWTNTMRFVGFGLLAFALAVVALPSAFAAPDPVSMLTPPTIEDGRPPGADDLLRAEADALRVPRLMRRYTMNADRDRLRRDDLETTISAGKRTNDGNERWIVDGTAG